MRPGILILLCYLCSFVNILAQAPEKESVYNVVQAHMNSYFPGGTREIISLDTLFYDNEPVILVVNLEEGGWILVSGDKRVIPVLGFNYEGYFTRPDKKDNITAYKWIYSYAEQIKEIREDKGLEAHKGWEVAAEGNKGRADERVVVEPLIKASWNQGGGWNRFCPEDSLGPGGHTYVGCVAVAMAQALSVYQVPDTGTYTNQYFRDEYGIIEARFNETHYKWDSMSLDKPDDYNALLLFHCAVAVNMNFGPDGSSANTSGTRSAMKRYFRMSARSIYQIRAYNEDNWEETIIADLLKGRPVIYAGNADDGETGHAFNIDGVNGTGSMGSDYFHVNWGWGGRYNGYYLIDNLKPGSRDYSKNNKAVFRIQPYYYPTDVVLTDTLVPVGKPAGTVISRAEVVDEASSNVYDIILESDSVYINNEWVYDYYLENDSVRTGRIFKEDDIGTDTIRFLVTDKYDNYIEAEIVLTVTPFTRSDLPSVYDSRFDEPKIYPNPASGIINIDLVNEQPVDYINIYSQSGLIVRKIENPSGHVGIDIKGLIGGLYIVEIRHADGIITRRKILIL